ncbi:signal peptidase I [Enterococcus haemoperoxidus ATCC BAA-382]|uniref:Signal peptidase I n=1 Tax=Enterococcus haemoperoxidus ATCC BAA-382 TaxID=1158608 RepID=R2SHP2_9ENTE|nr:signal peptidase I [Enterococcus haemoperoxidus]EOH92381.1 signal peptidase I [Enterococcus haemoperoxidus ATCC BAA-382]EOT61747.1 signal peptidase I [Enterococcus haemoperoxidus ATCC BAA-382]OJG50262.1 signal peptidase I [Enterococcus haemoperoxidus]
MEKKSKRTIKKKPTTARKKRPSQKVPAKKTGNKKRQHHNKKTKRKKQPVKNYLKELIVAISLSVVLILVISSFFLTIVTVHGFSMIPTLREKDQVLVQKTTDFKRFDLVAFKSGNGNTQIRRIIGLPEEKIAYTDDTLFVNDQPVDEKFIMDEINESQRNGKNYTEDFTNRTLTSAVAIPEGYYLVLGDNRPYATDSRHYGLIAKENVIGKVTMQLLPFGEMKSF